MHGLALDPTGEYLYAADDSGNAIWTYSIDSATGLLTQVSNISAPTTGANPRHATVHPQGTYLYVVLEEANEVAQYSIDPTTHIPEFTNVTYSLINDGKSLLPK